MTEDMNEKMEQTIQYLRASMPRQQPTKTSFGTLIRLAWSEVHIGFVALSLGAVLIFGLLAARFLREPMLVMLCTMPLPVLLLFHRCILCENTAMRELEETFRYSYTEMLAARASVISILTLGEALGAAMVFHGVFGESFLRLALCGSIPCLYLCALLLIICRKVRNQDQIAVLTAVIWSVLSIAAVRFSFDQILQLCSTGLYAGIACAGIILYVICLKQTQRGKFSYEPVIG